MPGRGRSGGGEDRSRGFGDEKDHDGGEGREGRGHDREHEATFKRNDWLCQMCSAHNFARNIHCFKCHQVKGCWDGDAAAGVDAASADKEKRGMRKADWRRADWKCSSCGYVNFARRTHCNSCSLPKSVESPESPSPLDATMEVREMTEAQPGTEEEFSLDGTSQSLRFQWNKEEAVRKLVPFLNAELVGEWVLRSKADERPLVHNAVTVRLSQVAGKQHASLVEAHRLPPTDLDVERLARSLSLIFSRMRLPRYASCTVCTKPPIEDLPLRTAVNAALSIADSTYFCSTAWAHPQHGYCQRTLYTFALSADYVLDVEITDGPSLK